MSSEPSPITDTWTTAAVLKTVPVTETAREAFFRNDEIASRIIHDAEQAPEAHAEEGSEYVKSLVYGGLDGVVTTFAIVAAAEGAGYGMDIVVLMGFSGLIADAISMGLGDYFSTLAVLDYQLLEKSREVWEYENNLQGEIKEMVDLHVKLGFTQDHATRAMEVYSKYQDPFIDLMMKMELNVEPPDADERSKAWKNGVVTFTSFVCFGSVGLWAYLTVFWASAGAASRSMQFFVSAGAVLVTLFLLGVVKAKFTGQRKISCGFEMMFNGSIASAAAYLVALVLDGLIVIEDCPCPQP